ncbi:MAG: hypothetical protein ACTSRP_00885 [Candidatus Helarchaeota archaeon]
MMKWYENLKMNPFNQEGLPKNPEKEYFEIPSRKEQYLRIKQFFKKGIDPTKLEQSKNILIIRGEYGTGKTLIHKYYENWINKKTNSVACYTEVSEFRNPNNVYQFLIIRIYYRLKRQIIEKLISRAHRSGKNVNEEKKRIEKKINNMEKDKLGFFYPFYLNDVEKEFNEDKKSNNFLVDDNYFFELLEGIVEICQEEMINSIFIFLDEIESIVGQKGGTLEKNLEECARLFLTSLRKLIDNLSNYKIKLVIGTTAIAWNTILELHPALERRIDLYQEDLEPIDFNDIEALIIHYLDSSRINKTRTIKPFTRQALKLMHRFRLGNIGKIISFAWNLIELAMEKRIDEIDSEFTKEVIFNKNILIKNVYDLELKRANIKENSLEKKIFDYLLFENFEPIKEKLEEDFNQYTKTQIDRALELLSENNLIEQEPIVIKDEIISALISRKPPTYITPQISTDSLKRVLSAAVTISKTDRLFYLTNAIEAILYEQFKDSKWIFEWDTNWNKNFENNLSNIEIFKNIRMKKAKISSTSPTYKRFGEKNGLFIIYNFYDDDNPLVKVEVLSEIYKIYIDNNFDFIIHIVYTKRPINNENLLFIGNSLNFLKKKIDPIHLNIGWITFEDISQFILIPSVRDPIIKIKNIKRKISNLLLTYGVYATDKLTNENDMKIYDSISDEIRSNAFSEYKFETKILDGYINSSYPLPNFKILKNKKSNFRYLNFYEKLFSRMKYTPFDHNEFDRVYRTIKPTILVKSDLIETIEKKLAITYRIKRRTIFDDLIINIIQNYGILKNGEYVIKFKDLYEKIFHNFATGQKIRVDDKLLLNFYLKTLEIRGYIEQFKENKIDYVKYVNKDYCSLIPNQIKKNLDLINSMKNEFKINDLIEKNQKLVRKWEVEFKYICDSETRENIEEHLAEIKGLYQELIEIYDAINSRYTNFKQKIINDYKKLPLPREIQEKINNFKNINSNIIKYIKNLKKIEDSIKDNIINKFKELTQIPIKDELIKKYEDSYRRIDELIKSDNLKFAKNELNNANEYYNKISKHLNNLGKNLKKEVINNLKNLKKGIKFILDNLNKIYKQNNLNFSLEDEMEKILNKTDKQIDSINKYKNFYEIKIIHSSQIFASPFYYEFLFKQKLIKCFNEDFKIYIQRIQDFNKDIIEIQEQIKILTEIINTFKSASIFNKSINEIYMDIDKFLKIFEKCSKIQKRSIILTLTKEESEIYSLIEHKKKFEEIIEHTKFEIEYVLRIFSNLYRKKLIDINASIRLI